ncbi:heme ABC exporter ATP-binding protein CcmA [Deinococcus aquiradiocola]|uniref:Heme ABC exporter ATP-binding protein CcmA n=1 Tax=Deinococcus aquiradiocola TaxID=393059 RepID=A0A917PNL9_9DEIO|nr:heme ABC exporter ATP-binding protein CcmA [Deinococcus aquiradiocola]GGJ85075.1 heme ABC exporter ATP-binding protein CcmA [Deinococcus aquiradiocola]
MVAALNAPAPTEQRDGTPAVQLRQVWLRLGRDAVLRDLNLDVTAGEAVTLLGRNGAGKSTLLRLIASAVSPTRGEGRIFGYDLRDRQSVRDHVHLLGHDLGLYPDLTPRENLHFALRMHTQTGDVDAALARVDLTRAADRRVRFLSAGMKKRLALTRLTLLSRPLALVDEPFANLDAQGRELAIELLTEARAAGSTLIVAAHEPELSLRVAARALTLDGGRIVEADA